MGAFEKEFEREQALLGVEAMNRCEKIGFLAENIERATVEALDRRPNEGDVKTLCIILNLVVSIQNLIASTQALDDKKGTDLAEWRKTLGKNVQNFRDWLANGYYKFPLIDESLKAIAHYSGYGHAVPSAIMRRFNGFGPSMFTVFE